MPAKASDARVAFERLRGQAARCRNCELWQCGTQTVFGNGAVPADLMFIGEQPGDQEDRAGRPFVGPAGRVLDRGLQEAGIDREKVYVTNAVKHFRWEARGKRRVHKKPGVTHIKACHPWLEEELQIVRPRLVVCLGAVAAQALLGKDFRLTKQRGLIIDPPGLPPTTATVHPSSILRARDDERDDAFAGFATDLRRVANALRKTG